MNYEQKLSLAKYINFLPYLGAGYAQATPKILILGHSHYANCDGTPEQLALWDGAPNRTREVILDDYLGTLAASGGKTHPHSWVRCYRKMATVLTGKPYHDSDYIWEQIAFSNFFQKHIGISPNDRQFCTNELLDLSRKAFFENLEILKPEYVVVWGSELVYYCLPQQGFIGITHNENPEGSPDELPWIGYYKDFPKIIFWWMKHPSAPSFSYNAEYENWKVVLELSKSYLLNGEI